MKITNFRKAIIFTLLIPPLSASATGFVNLPAAGKLIALFVIPQVILAQTQQVQLLQPLRQDLDLIILVLCLLMLRLFRVM
jgi:hypothetical protein